MCGSGHCPLYSARGRALDSRRGQRPGTGDSETAAAVLHTALHWDECQPDAEPDRPLSGPHSGTAKQQSLHRSRRYAIEARHHTHAHARVWLLCLPAHRSSRCGHDVIDTGGLFSHRAQAKMLRGPLGAARLQTLHAKLPHITPNMTNYSKKGYHGGRMALMLELAFESELKSFVRYICPIKVHTFTWMGRATTASSSSSTVSSMASPQHRFGGSRPRWQPSSQTGAFFAHTRAFRFEQTLHNLS